MVYFIKAIGLRSLTLFCKQIYLLLSFQDAAVLHHSKMVPRLIVLWLVASSPAWAEREERYLVKPTTEVSAVAREERYLVKPTTEVSAVNATELPLSFAANPLGTDAGDLVSGDSSVHPVSRSFVRFLLDSVEQFTQIGKYLP